MFIHPCFEFTHCQLGKIKSRANKTCSTVFTSVRVSTNLNLDSFVCDLNNDMFDFIVFSYEKRKAI